MGLGSGTSFGSEASLGLGPVWIWNQFGSDTSLGLGPVLDLRPVWVWDGFGSGTSFGSGISFGSDTDTGLFLVCALKLWCVPDGPVRVT